MSLAAPLPPATPRRDVDAREAAALLRSHDRILIVSHQRPDGDCLGSTLGLFFALERLGKLVAAYNSSPITEKWDFLKGIENVSNQLPTWTPSLTVFVDCGGIKRVADDFAPIGEVLNIDHHLTNERFGDYNFIDVAACAVGEQIYLLATLLDIEPDARMAAALYLSIMTDTGSFRYSSTTSRAFDLAGKLIAAGAEPGPLAQAVYETKDRGELVLTARVFSSIQYEFDGRLSWAELRAADYAAAGGADIEAENLVTDIRGVRGVEVSCLLHELPNGGIRAGFRGKGNVDCSAIAVACGGGGHFNASGVILRNTPFEDGKKLILAELRRHLAAWSAANPAAPKA